MLFYAFLAVGGIGLLYFSYMFASSVYRIFIPQNALLIDENGFCDYTVCQAGTGFVPWSNVDSIKVFGPEDEPLLGHHAQIDRPARGDPRQTGVQGIIRQYENRCARDHHQAIGRQNAAAAVGTRDEACRRAGRRPVCAENRRRDPRTAVKGHRPNFEAGSRRSGKRRKSR